MSITWAEGAGQTGHLVSGGRRLARYSWSAADNHPHLSHVRPLTHDGVLTNHKPWDHRWHHGLWFSWKFINDVLYWEDHPDYGHGRGAGLGRSHVVEHDVAAAAGRVVIRERLEWRPDGTDRVVLDEHRTMAVHADLGVPGAWAVDWQFHWRAVEDAVLSTTPYPEHWWGGYAGLNFRAARSMAARETILASGGLEGRAAVHASRVEWMAYGGCTDGAGTDEPEAPATGTVAILAEPAPALGRTPAYVFSAHEEMGFLAAAPLMHGDHVVPAGDVLRLGYRTVVLDRLPDREEIDHLYQQYAASPGSAE